MNEYHFIGSRRGGRTLQGIIIEFCQGNPGCMQFVTELINQRQECGKDPIELILEMYRHDVTGSRAYQLWNDCCGRDTEMAAEVIELVKKRKITKAELIEHVFQPYGKRFDVETYRNRAPQKQNAASEKYFEECPMGREKWTMHNEVMANRIYRNAICEVFESLEDDAGKTFMVTIEKNTRQGAHGKEVHIRVRKEEV